MKSDIAFHIQGNLMWLIDTSNNERYLLETIDTLKKEGYSEMINQSYENYINKVNNNPSYKYNDWRVPTKDELMMLVLKDNFFSRLLATKEQKENQICIDKNIFYDYQEGSYLTSTQCENSGHYVLSFDCLRFKQKKIMNSTPCSGVQVSCHTGKNHIRLVRDIK